MALNLENNKQQVIEEFRLTDADTGSVELQVALLSQRIGQLTEHCKINSKDFSSRRGLLKLVNRRRRFLQYIKDKDENSYKGLVERLGLRK
jgi:small subunit ribosomal protein S15